MLKNKIFNLCLTILGIISVIGLMFWDHCLSTYAKYSEKLTFLTPR